MRRSVGILFFGSIVISAFPGIRIKSIILDCSTIKCVFFFFRVPDWQQVCYFLIIIHGCENMLVDFDNLDKIIPVFWIFVPLSID